MSESINAGGYFVDSVTGEVSFKFMSVDVKGESRKLKVAWTIAEESDLRDEEKDNPLVILRFKDWKEKYYRADYSHSEGFMVSSGGNQSYVGGV